MTTDTTQTMTRKPGHVDPDKRLHVNNPKPVAEEAQGAEPNVSDQDDSTANSAETSDENAEVQTNVPAPAVVGGEHERTDAGHHHASPAKPRIKIGSQRESDPLHGGDATSTPVAPAPKPAAPAPAPKPVGPEPAREVVTADKPDEPQAPAKHVPVDVRQVNVDREFDEALAGVSIDHVMSDEKTAQAGEQLESDSRHQAAVIKVDEENAFFSLGAREEGVCPLIKFKEPPKVGDAMEVVVAGFNRDDQLYELNIPGAAVDVSSWADVTVGTVVEARVTGANTGGLECMVGTIRGFIPTSQIALYRVENLVEYINQKLQCVVTEANKRRRNLVLSHRAVLEREREEHRKEFIEGLQVGDVHDGVVRNMRDFGAFVELGHGVDGLIHISKLSWDHVKHPSEVLKEGQQVRVKIEKVNHQTGKVALTYRDLMEHPWARVEEKYTANSLVKGTVSRVAKFGAFVKLEPGVEGLIHISELAHHRVGQVGDILREDQEVEAKVLSVDAKAQRIALSLKATQPAPEPERVEGPDAKESPADQRRKKRKKPLKGGVDRPSGGEKFGLNW